MVPTKGTYHKIYVYQGDGTILPGWPVYLSMGWPEIYVSGLAVGDLEFDGNAEVLITYTIYSGGVNLDSPLYVIDGGGSIRNGWPVYPAQGSNLLLYPTVGDLDGDFSCEVVVSGQIGVRTWRPDGEIYSWPPAPALGAMRSNPCVDLDGDGDLEVVVPGHTLQIVGFQATQGSIQLAETDPGTYTTFDGATVGDVNGDGLSEIVVWSSNYQGNGRNAIHLYDMNLQELPGWPVEWPDYIYMGPVYGSGLADLDGDGDLEIIISREYMVHVWDQPNDGGGPVHVQWSMLGHDSTRSNYYHQGNPPPRVFLRGDASRSGRLDVADAVVLLGALFAQQPEDCPAQLDYDASGELDLSDATGLLAFLFLGTPPPPPPYPECGPEPEGESLPCFELVCP